MRGRVVLCVAMAVLGASVPQGSQPSMNAFRSSWPAGLTRPWAGPAYWANPLQDWRIHDGRLENIVAGGNRNVALLTREVAALGGDLEMSVRLGRLEEDTGPLGEGFAGFRFGIRGAFRDYRDSAVRGYGVNAGIAADGRLFVGEVKAGAPSIAPPFQNVTLRLRAVPEGADYAVSLTASKGSDKPVELRDRVAAEWIPGVVALVSSSGPVFRTPSPQPVTAASGDRKENARGGTVRFWFRDWTVSGSAVDAHEGRAFGPILFAMHTLSRRVMKLTAQLAPVEDPTAEVLLETRDASGWKKAASSRIDPLSRTATFRITGWDDTRDTPYRVVYGTHQYGGTIRKDPKTKPQIVVAAFTGNNDLGFPHADVVRNVQHFRPDLLVFTGDQLYERVGEYGIQRAPIGTAALDYLRKWYMFGWEYRDLMKDIPAVALPDDHDVYHGNVWGAAGRRAELRDGYEGPDQGGYVMPPEWVNMVQRTQTSNMPDPVDPAPVQQGIGVYFTDMLYGGLSTAIIEDRKWKSAPREMLPQAKIVNGWPQNPDYDAAKNRDVPGVELLGPRQEAFLEKWAADWSGGAWMKTVVSQTIFADVVTLPKGATTDAVTPKLPILQPGEYAQGEVPVMDHDSNSWPQVPRDRALRSMRKALAFHIAGDQHIGSTVQYGVEDWNDASWALCVPSVANYFPRRWYPSEPGRNRKAGSPLYTGEFLDGFGNKMTVHAVSNPSAVDVEPKALHQRAPGYGIATFDRATRSITIANWPRWVDAAAPGAKPYDGWPITIRQTDNGLPNKGWRLPRVAAPAMRQPVVQVLRGTDVVYTFRLTTNAYAAPVPGPGRYTVRLFDPDSGVEKVFADLEASATGKPPASKR